MAERWIWGLCWPLLATAYDCTMQKPEDWDISKRAYCCRNAPYYCAPYTMGCNAPCLYRNVTLTCQARMAFRHRVSYSKEKDGCLRAYWDVMDQCPVCSRCHATDVGCERTDTDCSGDPLTEKWNATTKEFCCLKKGKACPSLVFAPTQVHETRFDCEDHLWDWRTSWTQEQKDWCCKNHKTGCKGMPETKAPRSKAHVPDADFKIILQAQESLRPNQPWTPSPVQGPQAAKKSFHCDVALNNFRAAWSHAKKTWCCSHEAKGCDWEAPAVQMEYDCGGLDTSDWSRAKRDWCCTHQVVGCVEDDSVEFSRGEHDAAGEEHFREHVRGPEWPGGYEEFDCTVEVNNWQFAWGEEQKSYCCKTVGVGCKEDEVHYPKPSEADFFFDCSKDTPSKWSAKKRSVCCQSNADCSPRKLRGT